MGTDVTSKLAAALALMLALAAASAPAAAETCADTKAAPPSPQARSGANPSSVGNDGAAATGWTGGTGNISAGIENEKKGDAKAPGHSEEAKGLDPTKDKSGTTPKC